MGFIARLNYHESNTCGNDDLFRGRDVSDEWYDNDLRELQKAIWMKFHHIRKRGEGYGWCYDYKDGTMTDTNTKRIWPIDDSGRKCGPARVATENELKLAPMTDDEFDQWWNGED